MAVKSTLGKTKQYSGLVNSVGGYTKPEEPKMTPQQVAAAFQSFGYQPNQNNMNDVGYWSTRPVSEGAKLMSDLKKRREQDNLKSEDAKRQDEEFNKSKQSLPQLNDIEIKGMYDEYGLPAPDTNWVRNNLPNDPEKLRLILETQRNAATDMLKTHTKNMVNSMPQIPKASQSSAPTPIMGNTQPITQGATSYNMGGMGMGGPGDTPSPFFIGDHAVVRIVSPNNPQASTLWLVDSKKKILRPFMTDQSFENAFEDPEAAKKTITTLSSQDLGPNGPLNGFKLLGQEHGVKDDGSMGNIEYTPAQIARRYGQPSDPAVENKSLSILDGVFNNLKNIPQSNTAQALNDNPGGKV